MATTTHPSPEHAVMLGILANRTYRHLFLAQVGDAVRVGQGHRHAFVIDSHHWERPRSA